MLAGVDDVSGGLFVLCIDAGCRGALDGLRGVVDAEVLPVRDGE